MTRYRRTAKSASRGETPVAQQLEPLLPCSFPPAPVQLMTAAESDVEDNAINPRMGNQHTVRREVRERERERERERFVKTADEDDGKKIAAASDIGTSAPLTVLRGIE